MKVAILSNININPLVRLLSDNFKVFETEGYGNEIGMLLNPESSLHAFMPDYIFLIEDIAELLEHNYDEKQAEIIIKNWFRMFEKSIRQNYTYFISDAYFFSVEFEVFANQGLKQRLESIWEKHLAALEKVYENIRILRFRRVVEKLGEEEAFSRKMWYMGKIPYSMKLLKRLAGELSRLLDISISMSKKVLALDLDHTLWGGLAGEHEDSPVLLSEDGIGLAYKNFQRGILEIKNQGVLLGIVSKNNKEDALAVIQNHPHMILREKDFVSVKINWKPKQENLLEMAQELNLGLDSFVFLDDNPAERKLVKEFLPEVTVPEFSDQPENLTEMLIGVWHQYFEKSKLTKEDKEKTEMYQVNRQRENLKKSISDYDEYLKSLEMHMQRVNPEIHRTRLIQLINKTNQFNLTTKRFTEKEIDELLDCDNSEIFLYRVKDCFGDNGIVCVSIVEYKEEAVIIEFAMSCRVMGRKIENAILQEMEQAARKRGYKKMVGLYHPSAKNKPVADLYPSLGYQRVSEKMDETIVYEINITDRLTREYQIEILEEEKDA